MVRKLRVKGHGLTLMSQEMALDIACSTFEPDICVHTPGVQNVIADLLSRAFEPGYIFRVPGALMNIPRAALPIRSDPWWRSISPPLSSTSKGIYGGQLLSK